MAGDRRALPPRGAWARAGQIAGGAGDGGRCVWQAVLAVTQTPHHRGPSCTRKQEVLASQKRKLRQKRASWSLGHSAGLRAGLPDKGTGSSGHPTDAGSPAQRATSASRNSHHAFILLRPQAIEAIHHCTPNVPSKDYNPRRWSSNPLLLMKGCGCQV